jgi:GNAT superfamily N-acetyltransferase
MSEAARPGDTVEAAVQVRPMAPGDMPAVWGLVREFAEFVKLEHLATGSGERMGAHLFGGAWPPLGGFVAEDGGRLVGYALWFGTFSSFWTRPTLYLEDLYVSPSHRGRGAGLALFRAVAREALARECPTLHWSVLRWNQGAIEFYDRLGAERDEQEFHYRLGHERMIALTDAGPAEA